MRKSIRPRTVIALIVVVIALIVLTIFFPTDWLTILSDREALQEIVGRTGLMAPLLFLSIQIVQVIFAPIPGAVTGMVSGYLFGAFWGSVITQIGITIGSLIAFYLSKRLGRPLVERLVPDQTLTKLDEIVKRRGTSGLFLVFVIPFLPDDAICFVAGLTPIRYKQFIALVLLARTPSSVVSALTGAGLVSLSPIGWAVFAVASVLVAYLIFKYEDTISRKLINKI